MPDRLTVITTRSGDQGQTSLADGSRVPKTHARVVALGEVDELNSELGLLLAHFAELAQHEHLKPLAKLLKPVQHALFDIGSEIAIPGHAQLKPTQLAHLDHHAEQLNAKLPSLKEFILPGGSVLAAQAHVVRCVCRRAERAIVAMHEAELTQADSDQLLAQRYINRLSDLMFILARSINQALGEPDIFWNKTADN
jgi:cob(I)alamin adenosyltransferase